MDMPLNEQSGFDQQFLDSFRVRGLLCPKIRPGAACLASQPSRPSTALRSCVRTVRDQAVGDAASVGPDPRSLLGDLLEKCLPLLTGEDFDKPQSRLQENTITVGPSAVCGLIFARVKEIKF